MNSIETLNDPYAALTNIMESLLLSFDLSRERHRFTLVCDYPFMLPGAQRAFVGFVFEDVRDFARERGELAKLEELEELEELEDRYHLRSTAGGIVIQSIESTGTADARALALWFGPAFGGLQLRYGSARAYRRNALAEEVHGDWLYRDLHSQEELDFHEPFPGLMES